MRSIVQQLARAWGSRLVAIVVSGSWSRGDPTEFSDVDLDCVTSEGSFKELAFSLQARIFDITGGTEADWIRVATTPGRAWVLGDWSTWGQVTLYGDAGVGERVRQAITRVPQERFDAAAAELLADLIVCKNKVASALQREEPAGARWAAAHGANSAAAIVGLINRRAAGKPWGRHLKELLEDADAPPSFADTYMVLTTGASTELLEAARTLERSFVSWLSARGLKVPVVDDIVGATPFIEATVR